MTGTPPAPWQLPGRERPHHPLPLGEGIWRGPACGDGRDRRRLLAAGVSVSGIAADGAWLYRLPPENLDPSCWEAGDPDQPSQRGQWILARLAAAQHAHRQPRPTANWMAILNLTPDSFSDGGQLSGQDDAAIDRIRSRAVEHQNYGAAWLDLGAESTRPGASPVPATEQIRRLAPAWEALADFPLPCSIDTRSAEVAAAALDQGARMVNEVGMLGDPHLAPLCADRGADLVLMHSRGTPATMREHNHYRDLLGEVADEWMAVATHALDAGVSPNRLWMDPGIGFAKDAAQSQFLLAHLDALHALGFPLLVGPSRKSFLVELEDVDRDLASAGIAATSVLQGAAILRLHSGVHWGAARAAAALARHRHAVVASP